MLLLFLLQFVVTNVAIEPNRVDSPKLLLISVVGLILVEKKYSFEISDVKLSTLLFVTRSLWLLPNIYTILPFL